MAKWVPERGSTLRLVRRLIENCTIIHCLVLFLFSKVILVSHGSILFLRNSVIVRTIDGGEKWTNHQLPFQVTGPLLFHPRQEDWILGRGVVNGKVHVIFCLLYTTSVLTRPRPCGIPARKLKWRIKTKKMRPLGRRGKLRVKRT